MAETVQEWTRDWRRACAHAGETAQIDLLFDMSELTAEIISHTVFGRALDRRFTPEIIAGFAQYQRHAGMLAPPVMVGVPERYALPQGFRARRARTRVQRAIDHIIEETLRLCPLVPHLGRVAKEAGRFEHRRIRRGSLLLVSAWLLHGNKNVWAFRTTSCPSASTGPLPPGRTTTPASPLPPASGFVRAAPSR